MLRERVEEETEIKSIRLFRQDVITIQKMFPSLGVTTAVRRIVRKALRQMEEEVNRRMTNDKRSIVDTAAAILDERTTGSGEPGDAAEDRG